MFKIKMLSPLLTHSDSPNHPKDWIFRSNHGTLSPKGFFLLLTAFTVHELWPVFVFIMTVTENEIIDLEITQRVFKLKLLI